MSEKNAVVSDGADALRVDLAFTGKGNLAGLIWEAEGRWDHPLLAYATARDFRRCVLRFRWRSGGVKPLDAGRCRAGRCRPVRRGTRMGSDVPIASRRAWLDEQAYAGVVGLCIALHRGRTTHVWQTFITNDQQRLCAVVTQTQLVMEAKA